MHRWISTKCPVASGKSACCVWSSHRYLLSPLFKRLYAQSAEAVVDVAQVIALRIEGATQGSGVLVERDGNTYTVLTAWHVIALNNVGEEVDLIFQDGRSIQPPSILTKSL